MMKRFAPFLFAELLLTVTLAPLAYGTVEEWSVALFELNALALAVLLVWRMAAEPARTWPGWRLAAPLAAAVVLGVVQLLPWRAAIGNSEAWRTLSLDPQATRESALKLLALLIYFCVALHLLRNAQRRQRLLLVLTVLGAGVAFFAIAQKLTWNGKLYWLRPVSPYVAPFGPYANYNHFAGLMELLWPLPFAWLLFARGAIGQRALWLLAVVLMAAALFYSLSRGGMLAFAVQLAAFWWLSRRAGFAAEGGRLSRTAMVGLVAVLIAAFALWIGYDRLLWRFQSLRQGAQEYSVVTRLDYWRASWRLFLDHPVTGVGLGAFPAIYPHYGHSSAKLERLEKTHNDYLQVLTDAGVLGGLLLLWFVIELWRAARAQWLRLPQLPGAERAYVLGGGVALLGMAAHSAFDFNLQITANALVFLMISALLVTAGRNVEKA